jgi:hypothetical protein
VKTLNYWPAVFWHNFVCKFEKFTSMKRLYPALLVLASIVTAAVFTTVFAITMASYSKDSKVSVPTGTVNSTEHTTAHR